jgi:hypothetical protein
MRIIERFVKNDTPYSGRLILKIEKNPFYKSLKKGFLNKIHLNFFFFKLVTRVIPKINGRALEINENAKVLIEKYTGCELYQKVEENEESETGYIVTFNLIYDKKYNWGDVDFGWWMFKNLLMVSSECPKFLAFKYENGKIVGGHIKLRDNSININVGDRIFEPEYKPSSIHYEKKFWKNVVRKYKIDFNKSDKVTKTKMMGDGFKKYIPIQQLGRHRIETKEDLILSSQRIFDYLSN